MTDKPKQLVVFPRGGISEKDRRKLERNGVLVVETDDPSKVVTVLPLAPMVNDSDLLLAAMQAICTPGYQDTIRNAFVTKLNELIKKRMEAR